MLSVFILLFAAADLARTTPARRVPGDPDNGLRTARVEINPSASIPPQLAASAPVSVPPESLVETESSLFSSAGLFSSTGSLLASKVTVGATIENYLIMEELQRMTERTVKCANGRVVTVPHLDRMTKEQYEQACGGSGAEANMTDLQILGNKLGAGSGGVVYKARYTGPATDQIEKNDEVALKVLADSPLKYIRGFPTIPMVTDEQERDGCKILKLLESKAKAADLANYGGYDADYWKTTHRDLFMRCLVDMAHKGYMVYSLAPGSPPMGQFTNEHRQNIMQQYWKGVELMSEVSVKGYPMVLHRDIKPDNLHYSDAGKLTFVDFGKAVKYCPLEVITDPGDGDRPSWAGNDCTAAHYRQYERFRTYEPSEFFHYLYPYAPPEVQLEEYEFSVCTVQGDLERVRQSRRTKADLTTSQVGRTVYQYDVFSGGVLNWCLWTGKCNSAYKTWPYILGYSHPIGTYPPGKDWIPAARNPSDGVIPAHRDGSGGEKFGAIADFEKSFKPSYFEFLRYRFTSKYSKVAWETRNYETGGDFHQKKPTDTNYMPPVGPLDRDCGGAMTFDACERPKPSVLYGLTSAGLCQNPIPGEAWIQAAHNGPRKEPFGS